MGFLKFLKREKKSDFDELDLPPAPPSLDTEEFGADFDKGMELPEIPDFPEEKISAPEQKFDWEKEMPAEQGIEELQQGNFAAGPMPHISAPSATVPPEPVQPIKPDMPSFPAMAPEQPAPESPRFTPLDDYPKMERRLFAQEKRALKERPAGKAIYVKVDKFKAALGSINVVRSDLRKSEDALMKLENIKNSKDRSFDRIRNSLDDLQKKLIFIDKTLFKED